MAASEDEVPIPEALLCGTVGPNGRDLPKVRPSSLMFLKSFEHVPCGFSKCKSSNVFTTVFTFFDAQTMRQVYLLVGGDRDL